VEKCIIYRQLRDLTICFAQDQNFSKIYQIGKKKYKNSPDWQIAMFQGF
jgi:hypothetical protein